MSDRNKNTNELIAFAKVLSQQTEFGEVIRLVATKAAQVMNSDLALITMVNPDTRETIKTLIRHGKPAEILDYRKIHINVGGWVIHNKKSFMSKNIHSDKRFVKNSFEGIAVKSVFGVPLIIEGITIGAIILLYQEPFSHLNFNSTGTLENIAAISAPFLRNTQKIRQYFDSKIAESTLISKYKNVGLLGKSQVFIELLHSIEAAAKCDVRVLLNGKTGTGKELIAKSIHKFGPRADFPFISLDCGAIPANLLESELFGHKRGSFTGAESDRNGMFLEADKGTLFLDEINNMPIELQSKLLRVLQEGEIRPVGSDKIFKVDVRVIAASSVTLKILVDENIFREDLYYRLYVYPITIPDLNERREDIPLLAAHFLEKYSGRQKKNINNFHEETIEFLKHRQWKGNIRELENFVERVVASASADTSNIDIDSLPADLHEEFLEFRKKQNYFTQSKSLKSQVDEFETNLIRQTLIACNWNQSEAARRLKTSEKTIRYKMSLLNINND